MHINRYGSENSALAGLRVSVHVFAALSSEQKWQASAALSYGDTTHAMRVAAAALLIACLRWMMGILNSYTFHTIAFSPWQRPGEAAGALSGHMEREAQPMLTDWRLNPPHPGTRLTAMSLGSRNTGSQATGLMKHLLHTQRLTHRRHTPIYIPRKTRICSKSEW